MVAVCITTVSISCFFRVTSSVESHTAVNIQACSVRCLMLVPHKWFSYQQSTSTCICAPYQDTGTRTDGEDIFVPEVGSVLFVNTGMNIIMSSENSIYRCWLITLKQFLDEIVVTYRLYSDYILFINYV